MKPRQGRTRRRGSSLGERFGRFKAQTEARLATLEQQAETQAGISTEILENQVRAGNTLARIEQTTATFAKVAETIDRFIKQFEKTAGEGA